MIRRALATALTVIAASACRDTTAPLVPTQLALTTMPPATAQTGVAFTQQPVVQLRDVNGHDIAVGDVAVTVVIATGGGTLTGTTTIHTDNSGQAVFNLSISGTVGPRTLQFTTPTLPAVTSGAIELTAGPPSQLVLVSAPASVALSGVPFPQQPALQLRDSAGNDANQAGVMVVASLPVGGGTMGGVTSVQTNANGEAIFTDLSILGAGTHTLLFSASLVIPGTSTTITLPSPLQNSTPIANLSGAPGSTRWYVVSVPVGTAVLSVTTTGGTGDVNLYLRHDAVPTTATFDCAGAGATTDERCDIANPAAGSWYILLTGASAYSGVSLAVPTAAPCWSTAPGDRDGDRLPDCVETNTGVYLSQLDTGTDPREPDTDGDNLSDGDEVLGTRLGLDLPGMGVSPLRRDILLEYDWFDDDLDCGAHSHRPTAAAIAMVAAAFANGPVPNPDGTTGINIIGDYGQGGVFTGGNLIADADGVIDDGVIGLEFQAHKNANFAANRVGYFHYVLMPHRYGTNSSSSGQALLPGNDMIVSLYCANSDANVAHTIMHELGHNMLLRHGGFDNTNWKPNYNSVMNFLYQFTGIDNRCRPQGNGMLSYSVGTRPPLDENNLDETQGVCGNPPGPGWDWNGDGDALDGGLILDINGPPGGVGDGLLTLLSDYNDWANLVFSGLANSVAGANIVGPAEVVSCVHPELAWTTHR